MLGRGRAACSTFAWTIMPSRSLSFAACSTSPGGYGAMERAMERLRVLDLEGAEGQVAEAIARLPRVIEPTLMRVALLVLAQRLAEARSCVRSFGGDRALLELALRRHAATGTFPADQALLAELLAP